MRLIDADALKAHADITNWGEPYGCSFSVIDRQPTIEVDRDNTAEPDRRAE